MRKPYAPEATLIRYLLGELPPAERDAFEDNYFEISDLREQVDAMEDELIDSYVRGDLTPTQRQHFERWFLLSPERQEKLKFARALARYTLEPTPRVNIPSEGSGERFQTGSPEPLGAVVPSALSMAFDKALEKDPGERYQTMREMVVDLKRLARKTQGAPAKESSRSSLRDFLTFRSPGVQFAVVLALTLAILVPFAFLLITRMTSTATRREVAAAKKELPRSGQNQGGIGTNKDSVQHATSEKKGGELVPSDAPELSRLSKAKPRPSENTDESTKSQLSAPQVLAFTLTPALHGSRPASVAPTLKEDGERERNVVVVPQSGEYTVRLQVPITGEGYKDFALAVASSGRTIGKGLVQGTSSGRPGEPYIEIESKLLKPGEYILRLYGPEGVMQDEFRVVGETERGGDGAAPPR
jgi:anti-sigma factor RsiW